jgi:hypothetical protein
MTWRQGLDELCTSMNDWHMAAVIMVFVVGSMHHLDAMFIAFSSTILGAVGYHGYQQIKSGKDDSVVAPAAS